MKGKVSKMDKFNDCFYFDKNNCKLIKEEFQKVYENIDCCPHYMEATPYQKCLKKIQENIEYPKNLYKGTVIETIVYGKNSNELSSKVISNPLYFRYVDSCPLRETKVISPLTFDNISRNCLCVKLAEKVDGLGVAYKDDKAKCYRSICCYRDLISIIQDVVYEEIPDTYSIKELEEMLPKSEFLQYLKDRMDEVCE